MSKELEPCPFCGSSGEDLMLFCDPDEGPDNSGPSRSVRCAECHVDAPFYPSKAEAIAAWNRRARPSPTGEKVEADKEALIDFLVNYGGRCRDCADENGFCPRTGIGCGQRKQAAIFFVSALEYGSKHGFAGGYTFYSAATLAAANARVERLEKALDEARETNREFHRRVQVAEKFQSSAIGVAESWLLYVVGAPRGASFGDEGFHRPSYDEGRSVGAERVLYSIRQRLQRLQGRIDRAALTGGENG